MQSNQIEVGLGGGRLVQIASRKDTIMNCYLLESSGSGMIVMDGGNDCEEEGEFLYEQIKERGGHVKYWLISHAHEDHIGAFVWIAEHHRPLDIEIENVCFSFPDMDWIREADEEKETKRLIERFLKSVDELRLNVITPHKGDVFECGSVWVEALTEYNKDYDYEGLNPTSLLFLAHFPAREILFLGDSNESGQDEILRQCDPRKLRCDIVQMAHHGQRGVNRAFYELIQPKICLYPSPSWVWTNCDGKGPLATLETRRWMKEIGVQVSCPMCFGDYILI